MKMGMRAVVAVLFFCLAGLANASLQIDYGTVVESYYPTNSPSTYYAPGTQPSGPNTPAPVNPAGSGPWLTALFTQSVTGAGQPVQLTLTRSTAGWVTSEYVGLIGFNIGPDLVTGGNVGSWSITETSNGPAISPKTGDGYFFAYNSTNGNIDDSTRAGGVGYSLVVSLSNAISTKVLGTGGVTSVSFTITPPTGVTISPASFDYDLPNPYWYLSEIGVYTSALADVPNGDAQNAYIVPIPEPATLIVWSLLGGASWLGMRVVQRGRRVGRQPWSEENRAAILAIIGKR